MSETLREQLAPIRADMRAGRPEVRPIVQITCELAGESSAAAALARKTILEWLRDKQRIKNLPANAWEGESFELDVSQDRPIAVEAHGAIWAMRYDNPDMEVAGRNWRTEAIIAWRKDVAMVGARLSVISQEWDLPITKSVPRVVSALCVAPGLQDYGFPLGPKAWKCTSDDDLTQLVRLLEARGRTRPVYVVTEGRQGKYCINAEVLAAHTAGLAHVVSLDSDAAWKLSERVGKTRSAFGGAIRTYNPGFSSLSAIFEEHPIATPEWIARRFPDERLFVQLLTLKAIDNSVTPGNLTERLPDFAQVRRGIAAKRLKDARSEHVSTQELLTLFETDNAALRLDLSASEDLTRQLEDRVSRARTEIEGLEGDAYRLRARIAQLEAALNSKGRPEQIEYPDSLEEIDEWVSRYLGGSLVLLSRAVRSARKAKFSDIRLVYDTLLLLGRDYRRLCLGEIAADEFRVAHQKLGIEISPTGNQARLMQWREDYEVEWRGTKRLLDMHAKKGSSHDARTCMRVYFFWDEDNDQVVVGHLPDHLTNDLT